MIIFEPEGLKFHMTDDITILKAAKEVGIEIRSECGGEGSCGKCRVIIEDQRNVNTLTSKENFLLTQYEIKTGYRLACRTFIKKFSENLTIMIPKESRILERKFQELGVENVVELNPIINKYHVILSESNLQDNVPDLERLLDYLKTRYNLNNLIIDINILQNMPDILRKSNWNFTVSVLDETEITSIEAGDTTRENFGLAVDLGTSKIVSHLANLSTGETIAIASIENPQIMYGEDIISRIAFTNQAHGNLKLLQKLAVQGINDTIRELSLKTEVNSNQILGATVVGNTAMHHIFLGINPKYLAISPFTPVFKKQIYVKAEQVYLNLNKNCIVNILPIVAGFVGSDGVADILASGIFDSKDAALLIDVGTNTEIFLKSDDKILSCSCASGPAFEGVHINQGIKAVTGAIENLTISSDTLDVFYKTIENVKPIGICGSAIIDIIAGMLRNKIISPMGRFNHNINSNRLKKIDSQYKFIIAWKNETEIGKDIAISEKDISEVQLAKAAIFTGCSLLMEKKELKNEDLKEVIIAGAFGNNINSHNAKTIGLIPNVSSQKIKFIGNGAIAGAKMALISKQIREKANIISKVVENIELSIEPNFNKKFISALPFPKEIDSS